MSATTTKDESIRKDSPSMGSSELLGRKVKRLTLEVPRSLHTRLKRASVDHDTFIRDIVVEACEAWLKEKGY